MELIETIKNGGTDMNRRGNKRRTVKREKVESKSTQKGAIRTGKNRNKRRKNNTVTPKPNHEWKQKIKCGPIAGNKRGNNNKGVQKRGSREEHKRGTEEGTM